MATTLPRKKAEKIQYFQDRIPLYTTNQAAIGASSADITAITALTTAARDAFNAYNEAVVVAKQLLGDADIAINAMAEKGAVIIEGARLKAKATGNESVYTMAGLPIPSTPAHKGDPGTPYAYKLELQPDGSLKMKFKCNNPVGTTGTIYHVYRQIDDGAFVYLGGSGQKQFVDTTIPTGVTKLTYKIQAVRSNAIGVCGEFTVKFGPNSSGGMTATLAPSVKMAA